MVQSDWSIPRRSFHRRVFVAAGIYNLVWGAFSVLDPQWFFRVSDMPAANHPQIFATLGMVIGLYGILYLEVARVPERGWMIAAVGLAGKVLGPIGLIYLIVVGVWPAKTLVIAVTKRLHLVALLHALSRGRLARVPGRSRASLTMGLELAVIVRSPL